VCFKKKILLLGGSSYVGQNILKAYGADWIAATYHSQPIPNGIFYDALSMELTDVINNPAEFSHALILLGDTKPGSCARDPRKSHQLNVVRIERLIDQLNNFGIKPVFFSSEYVFDGQKGDYTEWDEPKPILLYGKQKLEVEKYIKSKSRDYLIVRLAKTYGSTPGDNTLLTNWLEVVCGINNIKCAADQIFSPIYINDVVAGVRAMLVNDLYGVYHLSCGVAYKRIDILQMLIRTISNTLKLDIQITPCSINDFGLNEAMPINVSMNSNKLSKVIAMKYHKIDLICKTMVENWLNAKR